jgi:hypothetical protein
MLTLYENAPRNFMYLGPKENFLHFLKPAVDTLFYFAQNAAYFLILSIFC